MINRLYDKLVAFDWNGTLLSDTKTIVSADNRILNTFGIKPISVRTFQEHFDVPIMKYWKDIGLSDAFLKKYKPDFLIHNMAEIIKHY